MEKLLNDEKLQVIEAIAVLIKAGYIPESVLLEVISDYENTKKKIFEAGQKALDSLNKSPQNDKE
jgi:hypothetical protein